MSSTHPPQRHSWAAGTGERVWAGPQGSSLCSVPVELPPADAGMEAGTRAVLWEHRGPEACRADSPHRALSRLTDQRGKTSSKEICAPDNIPTLGTGSPSQDRAVAAWQPAPAEWEGNDACFAWRLCCLPPDCGHRAGRNAIPPSGPNENTSLLLWAQIYGLGLTVLSR